MFEIRRLCSGYGGREYWITVGSFDLITEAEDEVSRLATVYPTATFRVWCDECPN